jgi:hypothetical protein
MSQTLTLLLEAHRVRVLRGTGEASGALTEVAWSPEAPEAMVDAVRAQVGTSSDVVLVVGLAFLEIAQPELPPIDHESARAVLWRDADRYFPLSEPIAVVSRDGFALALPSRQLDAWVRACTALGTVRAVFAAPMVCAQVLGTGTCSLPAGDHEVGVVSATGGRLQSVRRAPRVDENAAMPSAVPSALPVVAAAMSAMVPADLLRAARGWIDAPLDAQLLHATLAETMRGARQRRWLVSLACAACAVVGLLWSMDHRREAQLAAWRARVSELETQSAPAVLAEARGTRARAELSLLAASASARTGPDAPLVALGHLSRILPRDAFVQRLEWNGQLWRVEGTADNAPRLVPLLDGDPNFRDVRIAAPSQRFLDVGRPRESFAISFNLRVHGGRHVAP